MSTNSENENNAQDPKELFDAYEPQILRYERLSERVAQELKTKTIAAGIRATITHRAKDMRSLVKKCMLYKGSVDQVRDRAGVKAVVRFQAEVRELSGILSALYNVVDSEVKRDTYKPDQLGYLGTHYHIMLSEHEDDPDLAGLECEVIIHTGSETLWDSISHELIYKPYVELPIESKRTLNRLLALVELFDKEVTSVRTEYVESPHYQSAHILDTLEKYFYRVDQREYVKEMSIRIIEALTPYLSPERLKGFDAAMQEFFDNNQDVLKNVYEKFQAADDRRGIFLHQPESLLIFAMFEWNQRDAVKQAWLPMYSRASLSELASLWGITITPH